MLTDEALRLARLWRAGKLAGGDPYDVVEVLLASHEELAAALAREQEAQPARYWSIADDANKCIHKAHCLATSKEMQALRLKVAEAAQPAAQEPSMRHILMTQIWWLIDLAEQYARLMHKRGDTDERDRIQGAIDHARKVVEPYNYNGPDRAQPAAQESEDRNDQMRRQQSLRDQAIWDRGYTAAVEEMERDAARRAQPAAAPDAVAMWAQAYAAFQGAFGNAVARRKDSCEYAEDARKRLREFNEVMTQWAAQPAAQEPKP